MRVPPPLLSRLLAVGVGLCLATGAADAQTSSADGAQDYRLQPGDQVDVTVLEDSNLNRQVLVRPDGQISLPLAGTLPAAGRSLEALQASIRAELASDFVQPPTVSAALASTVTGGPEGVEAASVYVLGEVRQPGRLDYEAEEPITLLQALALAGGPAVFAARERIQLRRTENGVETVTMFDYEAVESEALPAPGLELADGDVIVVPERGLFE